MFYLIICFNNRLYKKAFYILLFHILFGLAVISIITLIYTQLGHLESFENQKKYLFHISFLYIPGIIFNFYLMTSHANKGKIIHSDLGFLTAIPFSVFFLFEIVFLYFSGYESLKNHLLSAVGIFNFGICAMQARIFLSNHTSSLSWKARLRERNIHAVLVLFDMVFIFTLLVAVFFDFEQMARILLFLYGFRLMRILLLVPYFEQVWKSISRGIRLTANYVTSFLVILLVFSMNSRMLFSSEGTDFKSLPNSIYSNFQIILGNGFDMAGESSLMRLYVFVVTLIIGIIFTSTITALITDSLLAKKDEKEQVESNVMPWYKKDKEELRAVYIIRLCAYLSKI